MMLGQIKIKGKATLKIITKPQPRVGHTLQWPDKAAEHDGREEGAGRGMMMNLLKMKLS